MALFRGTPRRVIKSLVEAAAPGGVASAVDEVVGCVPARRVGRSSHSHGQRKWNGSDRRAVRAHLYFIIIPQIPPSISTSLLLRCRQRSAVAVETAKQHSPSIKSTSASGMQADNYGDTTQISIAALIFFLSS